MLLGVNIDHIATLRNARGGVEPNVFEGAKICIANGGDSITTHLREDRRHIKDDDVRQIKKELDTKLNLEMAMTDEMQAFALDVMPDAICLVPERREELTTEGGLDIAGQLERGIKFIKPLVDKGIEVSLFIDPDEEQVLAAQEAAEAAQNSSSSGGNYNKYTGGTMAWPTRIEKKVNSIYAPSGRNDTFGYTGSAHRGVDIRAPHGTPLYAAADGQVIYVNKSGWGGGYGLYVVISHGNGIYTLYAHGSSVPSYINVGATVTTDTVILYSGNTGASEGAHLHFEVWEGRNNRVNPCPYLGIQNKVGYVY